MNENELLLTIANDKIRSGIDLLNKLANFEEIPGVSKLKRKIKQEITFLRENLQKNSLKREHVHCSNLTHFEALVDVLLLVQNCTFVNRNFSLNDRKVNVDIVCDNGLTWIKVVACNRRALSQAHAGDANYGTRSIVHFADNYMKCAQCNPICYLTPTVTFYFAQGVEQDIVEELKLKNVRVATRTDSEVLHGNPDLSKDWSVSLQTFPVQLVNLDVSTMIAYVSNLTNGFHKFIFKEPILTQQANWEGIKPVKVVLDTIFAGKNLVCCQTAARDFETILNMVGGSSEQQRGINLLQRLSVLPDNYSNDGTEIVGNNMLLEGGKIKKRSRLIFEFGYRMKALTVSANVGFVRAAKQQGLHLTCFIHESRALTELKQATATVCEDSIT